MDRVPNSLSVRENQPLGVRKGDESRTKFARALPTGRSSDANRGIAQPGSKSIHDPTGAVRDFGCLLQLRSHQRAWAHPRDLLETGVQRVPVGSYGVCGLTSMCHT